MDQREDEKRFFNHLLFEGFTRKEAEVEVKFHFGYRHAYKKDEDENGHVSNGTMWEIEGVCRTVRNLRSTLEVNRRATIQKYCLNNPPVFWFQKEGTKNAKENSN